MVLTVLCLASCQQSSADEPPRFDEGALYLGEFEDGWGDAPAAPRNWFEARRDELLEAFTLRLSLGPGLGARASLTRLAQAGIMVQGPSEAFGQILRMDTLHFGNSGAEIGVWDVHSSEYGLSLWYSYEEDVYGFYDPSLPWKGSYSDRSPASLEVAAHLGLVGGVVGFDPWGFARFVRGFLGFGEAGWFDEEPGGEASEEPDDGHGEGASNPELGLLRASPAQSLSAL